MPETEKTNMTPQTKDPYVDGIVNYIIKSNDFLSKHQNIEDLKKIISKYKKELLKIFKTSKEFENGVPEANLKRFINLRGVDVFISAIIKNGKVPDNVKSKPRPNNVKYSYSQGIAKYIFKNNNFLSTHEREEDLEEIISKKEKELQKIFKSVDDFINKVSKERLSKIVNLKVVDSFISKEIEVHKPPLAPIFPGKLVGIDPEDRKYATAISNIIINCNSALKQYKKDVPKNKINSEPNREQIINAVLTCKDFKRLKKTYKNSLEFLEKAEIKFFHTNKTPEDVRKSLDRIIEKIKLEKKEHSANKKAGIKALTPAEKKIYVEEALKFIANSKFPNFIKTRCLPDISKFFEKMQIYFIINIKSMEKLR